MVILSHVRGTDEELQQVEHGSAREGVEVLPSLVAQVRIPLVVEHLVSREVHAGVKNLRQQILYLMGSTVVGAFKNRTEFYDPASFKFINYNKLKPQVSLGFTDRGTSIHYVRFSGEWGRESVRISP